MMQGCRVQGADQVAFERILLVDLAQEVRRCVADWRYCVVVYEVAELVVVRNASCGIRIIEARWRD